MIQFAWSVNGLVIVTVTVVEFDETSPLHESNTYLETFAVTFDGLDAVTVTVELGEYQALGVVVPPFEFTVNKYCVA
jgi:hypothetical protein